MSISVCMATYNGERFVLQQLISVLEQLGPDDEIIVSDDHSNDTTVAQVKSLGDSRVRVFEHNKNVGYTRNFERALGLAAGDVVFLADQDDVWLPGKVNTVLQALARSDVVVHDLRVVDQDLKLVAKSHFERYGVKGGLVNNLLRTRYVGAAMAMRRPVLEVALPMPRRADLAAHDYWLALVGEAFFDVALIDEPLMLYRRHDSTTSTGGEKSSNTLVHRLASRAYCASQLATRVRAARVSALSRSSR